MRAHFRARPQQRVWRDHHPDVYYRHMATIAVDTYKTVTRLQERGFTKQQAEALVEAAQEIDLSAFATKADIKDLKDDLIKWFSGMLLAQAAVVVALIQYFK